MDPKLNFGPWSADELAVTVSNADGRGSDSRLPRTVRFQVGISRLVRRRYGQPLAINDPARPAVFLLQPTPSESALPFSPIRRPTLSSGQTTVTSRVWFTNEGSNSGQFIQLDFEDDDQYFQFVTDTLTLGHIPAIFFDPRPLEQELRFYPNGLSDPDTVQVVSLDRHATTLDHLFEIIDHTVNHFLVTPSAQAPRGKIWHDSQKHWPIKDVEQQIQSYLAVALQSSLQNHRVRWEVPEVTGRLDIEIEHQDSLDLTNVTRIAVLELKVLRSFGSTGDTVSDAETKNWVEAGIKQAYSYKREKGFRDGALCCFDMRSNDTYQDCFAHVEELADTLGIELRRWYLHSSSASLRNAMTAQAVYTGVNTSNVSSNSSAPPC